MKTLLSICLASLLMATGGAVRAGPAEVMQVIEQHRQRGFVAPAIAIDELLNAGKGIDGAPVELRMRYHNALAQLYVAEENHPRFKAQLDALARMEREENCTPCGHYKLVREIHHAMRVQDSRKARALAGGLDHIKSADKHLMQAVHYTRAGVLDSSGNHARALEEAMLASRLAIEINNPAEQVRTLNMMLLSNVARGDLERAGSLAREAYALAERIGFVYMLPYIRGNEGWVFSSKGDKVNQLRALNDVLEITRKYKNMADSELIALVNLAEYHATAREFKQAALLAEEAIALADKVGKPIAKGVVLGTLGQAQIGMGEFERGVATTEEGLKVLEQAGASSYLVKSYAMAAESYEQAGRPAQSLAALRKFVTMSEEANQKAREKAITEAQEKFSGERKDHEIERLSLENARRQAEVAARAWQQRLWATAAVALALGAVLLIQMVSRARRRNRVLEDSNAVLSDQSVHDPLTGAYNRRHCAELMGQQQLMLANKSRDRNCKASVGLMLLDVDHFKRVNDTHGHAAGDQVLIEVARRLQQLVRQHDVVVRWGGEEFVLILPGTSTDGMLVLAERVLNTVAEQSVPVGATEIPVTVSAGCVCYPLLPGQHWEDALKVADLAMYMAKQGGRNRAVCVMQVEQGVTSEALLTDLSGAAAGGQATLQTIMGPVSRQERETIMAI
ncbi:GGDEF domain-containing protein [Massilia sp. PAMC28688]|uniref:GGDEF domain-containing protein n=1 Tax=Massilia sp. PAMC28688 TaxID=2861283 RepID=UPI001C629CEC|nr:GGDEF domain-containing protein [Massilia sp. PAMC28688]QYF92729.1 GGDEF domain-containing protein [Massilia sp. PAMC28688]